ncbi:MAG: hypothetical protein C0498_01700 [Anaerolinea sp.]|nr:hypothetical protein [Anaerolinea sp.]
MTAFDWTDRLRRPVTEYRRTCRRCGVVRYVPVAIATAKPQKASRLAGWLTPVVGRRRQQVNAERSLIADHNARIAEERRCRSCGSESYDEEEA